MSDPTQSAREKAERLASSLGNEVPGDEREPQAPPAGIIDSRIVRLLLFIVTAIGLMLTGAICILAVWGVLTSETAWRTVATFAIAMVTLGLFVLLNEAFGGRTRTL